MTSITCPSVLVSARLKHRDIAPSTDTMESKAIDNYFDGVTLQAGTDFHTNYYVGIQQCNEFNGAIEITDLNTTGNVKIKISNLNTERSLVQVEWLTYYYNDVTIYRSYGSDPTAHEYIIDCKGKIDDTVLDSIDTNSITDFVNLDTLHAVMNITRQTFDTLIWAYSNSTAPSNPVAEDIIKLFDVTVEKIKDHVSSQM